MLPAKLNRLLSRKQFLKNAYPNIGIFTQYATDYNFFNKKGEFLISFTQYVKGICAKPRKSRFMTSPKN
jgi:hypothetical protein